MNYFLILILPVAMFYLGARATITSFLWSRYPAWLAKLTDCAACSGFWYGYIVSLVLCPFDNYVDRFQYGAVAGLVTLVTTPIGAAIMFRALEIIGTTYEEPEK